MGAAAEAEVAALVAGAAALVGAAAAALVGAAAELLEPALLLELLPHAARDRADTSPTAASRTARCVRTEFPFR